MGQQIGAPVGQKCFWYSEQGDYLLNLLNEWLFGPGQGIPLAI